MDETPPRIHNIGAIIDKFSKKLPIAITDDYDTLFDNLTKYYISNRYPDFISKLSESVDKHEAERVLEKTKEVFAWLLAMKP